MSKQQEMTAIIYDKRGRILSIGKNSYVKTHPVQLRYAERVGRPEKIYLHAEIDAIIRCRDLSRAYRIFVSRVGARGYLLAKPCEVCMEAIRSVGIEVVNWSEPSDEAHTNK